MEHLWAPWRMQYINKIHTSGCFLCQAIESDNDEDHCILVRGKQSIVIMNIYPYNSGHLMVAPIQHTGEMGDLPEQNMLELFAMINIYKNKIQKTMNPDGFNIGMNLGRSAGAGLLDHLHIHIVPRWNGDTNFLPVLGETKVLPQSIKDTYQLLKNA
ncbi:MAG: HIT domain-containing protein [Chlamydiota bacterium]|nr:HIT domain-containing protein [Chlamydiota bacterium]